MPAIDPNQSATTPTIERCDRFYDPTDQTQWTVFQAHKNRKYVILQCADASKGLPRRVERPDMARYIKEQKPTTLRRGQTVYCGDHRCVVNGFNRNWIFLWGPFGDEQGHEHENMIEVASMGAYGLRLPFPNEADMIFTPRSSEEIHEQIGKLEQVRAVIPDHIHGLPDKIHACIDSQIDVLKKRQTSQQVFETRGEDWEKVGMARLMAARWMEGIAPPPPIHRWTETAKFEISGTPPSATLAA